MSDDSLDFELIGIVAHDMKAPIGAVRGFLELLAQAGDLNEQQAKFLSRALLGLDRMEHLVLHTLDMVRVETQSELNLQACDVLRLIRDSVTLMEPLAAERAISIEIEAPPKVAPVVADGSRVEQVLSNLLSNAIKYNRDNGNVKVTISDSPEMVLVQVTDTGHGIEPEDQQHIFERFFRSARARKLNYEGTGLGLFIAQAIVKRHQGHIWLDSHPGQGSTFSFTLPRANGAWEGADRQPALAFELGEDDRDRIDIYRHEGGVEMPDGVNDDDQEALGKVETDSTSDLV